MKGRNANIFATGVDAGFQMFYTAVLGKRPALEITDSVHG